MWAESNDQYRTMVQARTSSTRPACSSELSSGDQKREQNKATLVGLESTPPKRIDFESIELDHSPNVHAQLVWVSSAGLLSISPDSGVGLRPKLISRTLFAVDNGTWSFVFHRLAKAVVWHWRTVYIPAMSYLITLLKRAGPNNNSVSLKAEI